MTAPSPHVLGLDLALAHAGAAQLHQDGRIYTQLLDTEPLGDLAPIDAVCARIRDITAWAIGRATQGTVLVVIEAPSFGSKFGQPHERAGLWWAVARQFHRHGIPLAKVAPSTLKQRITGRGDASKAEVRRAISALYPGHGLARVSYDESDAAGLATLGVIKLAAVHGKTGPWSGPWLDARALAVDTGAQWPDLTGVGA